MKLDVLAKHVLVKRIGGPKRLRNTVLAAARSVRGGALDSGYGDRILFQLRGAKEAIAIP